MANLKCKNPNCNEPRMVSATGVVQTYCVEHMREYWREAAQNKRPNRPVPFGITSVGDNGTAIERDAADARHAAIQKQIEESKQRVAAKRAEVPVPTVENIPPVVIKPVVPTHEETLANRPLDFDPPTGKPCTTGCADCLYRDVVELLEKRIPGVREIVDGLKTLNRK